MLTSVLGTVTTRGGLRLRCIHSATCSWVKEQIDAALRRYAELDAQRVRVETHDGEVTLRGAVRSWPERQQVERAAWAAPGVSHVTNEIVVAPATA